MPTVPTPDQIMAATPAPTADVPDASAMVGQVLVMLAEIIAANALLLPAITELGQSLFVTGPGTAPTPQPTGTTTLSETPFDQPGPSILPQPSTGAAQIMPAAAVAPATRTPDVVPNGKRRQRDISGERHFPATMATRHEPRHVTSSGSPNDRRAPVLTMLPSTLGMTDAIPSFEGQESFSPIEPSLQATPGLRNIDQPQASGVDLQADSNNQPAQQQVLVRSSRPVNTIAPVSGRLRSAASLSSSPAANGTIPARTEIQQDPKMRETSDPSGDFSGSTRGSIFLDSAALGRWMMDHLAKEASRPISGMTGADPRVTASYPGAPIGT